MVWQTYTYSTSSGWRQRRLGVLITDSCKTKIQRSNLCTSNCSGYMLHATMSLLAIKDHCQSAWSSCPYAMFSSYCDAPVQKTCPRGRHAMPSRFKTEFRPNNSSSYEPIGTLSCHSSQNDTGSHSFRLSLSQLCFLLLLLVTSHLHQRLIVHSHI
jgi:hypothetical protein